MLIGYWQQYMLFKKRNRIKSTTMRYWKRHHLVYVSFDDRSDASTGRLTGAGAGAAVGGRRAVAHAFGQRRAAADRAVSASGLIACPFPVMDSILLNHSVKRHRCIGLDVE
ncbi:hypothetical protein EVAR_23894_1 [Eumeta japonica]|uniref:Uncharacterized protein n=1 Tax=Eumeta variegata TaxID=151549 RepID=A0A4C1V3Z7_EUMVA|nr:hypothetical protein EVAR_23894_1 [Eumeta japonica]